MKTMEKEIVPVTGTKQNLEAGEIMPLIDKIAERSYGKLRVSINCTQSWLTM